jgi:peptidoglycan/xylan/chitin deacetylase (PgdA/CDA1 family)
LSTLVDNYGKRRVMLTLLLGLVVTGTALLVQAQVEGMEYDAESDARGRSAGGWSGHGAPVAAVRQPVRQRPGSLDSPAPSTSASDLEPTPVRRLPATPTAVPLPTPDGTSRRAVVPVLMYHHVGLADPTADAIRRDLSVSPANFEAQLRYLIARGYQPITLETLVLHLQIGQPLPAKPVILTFDDGFKDQYTNAYPLLEKYGFRGTFFVITRFADEERPEYMSWSEIEFLHAQGMEIGSHSYTHPSLQGKSFDYLVWQMLGSKEAIEARTHQPVRTFSYPSGQYDQLAIDVLRSAGYWTAVTVEAGSMQTTERPFELRRIRVRGSYDLKEFDHWFNHWLMNP